MGKCPGATRRSGRRGASTPVPRAGTLPLHLVRTIRQRERNDVHDVGGGDARRLLEPIAQPVVERGAALGGVARRLEIDARRKDAVCHQSAVYRVRTQQTANEQAGDHEQHGRYRDLARHEHGAKSRSLRSRGACAFFQRGQNIRPRRPHRRGEPTGDGRRDCQAHGRGDKAPVDDERETEGHGRGQRRDGAPQSGGRRRAQARRPPGRLSRRAAGSRSTADGRFSSGSRRAPASC